jgi:flagellar motility protein MotE (MotC chaperone)
MKSVLIISSVTFLLIFGGISALSLQLSQQTGGGESALDPADQAAGQRLLRDVNVERDRLQREREYLAGMRQSQAAREVLMGQVHDQLLQTIQKIDQRQDVFIAEQDAAADRLAKMYEAMKPQKAAVILSALDMDVTIAILARMKERQAARILASMEAGLAARISTRLSLKEGA